MEVTYLISKGAATAQWIRLCLPSCRHGFESKAFIIYSNCAIFVVWKNKKRPGLVHLKTFNNQGLEIDPLKMDTLVQLCAKFDSYSKCFTNVQSGQILNCQTGTFTFLGIAEGSMSMHDLMYLEGPSQILWLLFKVSTGIIFHKRSLSSAFLFR